MKKLLIWICTLAIATTLIGKEQIKALSEAPTIKVLIKKKSDGALVEIKGGYKIYNPLNHKLLSMGLQGKRYYALPHFAGIKWGEEFPGIFQVQIVPSNPATPILIDGIEYRGKLEIYHVDDRIHIINEIDIENYLRSSLSTQFGQKRLSQSLLETLTIIARTDAHYTTLRYADAFWHVDANASQYNGFTPTLIPKQIDRAVEATQHLIMTYKNDPFPCAWTSNCAGATASYSAIHRIDAPCPIGVESKYALDNKHLYEWKYTIPAKKLAEICDISKITIVELFIDKHSNRSYGIRVKNKKEHRDFSIMEFMEMLGGNALKSNFFKVYLDNNDICFEGNGEGLGVGLCLFTAEKMAEKGKKAKDILAEFFPLTIMERIGSFTSQVETKK